jgi:predicted XRE-type DNA-binding protein
MGDSRIPEEVTPGRRNTAVRTRRDRVKTEATAPAVHVEEGPLALIRGSSNTFDDLGIPEAEILHVKALLAAEIIKTLDRRGLSVRAAQALTGVAAADFSRIRNATLGRFTIDRLLGVALKLECGVSVGLVPHRATRRQRD